MASHMAGAKWQDRCPYGEYPCASTLAPSGYWRRASETLFCKLPPPRLYSPYGEYPSPAERCDGSSPHASGLVVFGGVFSLATG
jgi:hypothetical protein